MLAYENNLMKCHHLTKIITVLILLLVSLSSNGEKIKVRDAAKIVGLDDIQLSGYGVVIGLKGTGDNIKNEVTKTSIMNYLNNLGISVNSTNLVSKNIASVIVSGKISPFSKSGMSFDINVSSIFDARSLEGGFLLKTLLKDIDGNTIGIAQGSVITPKSGIKTSGNIPGGGTVVSNISKNFIQDGKIRLHFDDDSPQAISSFISALKEQFEETNIVVEVEDLSTVSVEIPSKFEGNEIEFISKLMDTDIEYTPTPTIMIDPKNNTLVISGDINISPVSISYKGMKIEFSEIGGIMEYGEIYSIPSNNLSDFVQFLFKNGFKAEDIINVLSLMKEAGAIKVRIKTR
jgi:flagellar P-ring protein precursor FlgI